MTQPVIDTLKLADSLKESGFPDRQAEGLGRALTEHVATKADLDSAIRLVRSDIDALGKKFEAEFNSLRTQIRFVFAMLAALLALGLIDTAVPLIA